MASFLKALVAVTVLAAVLFILHQALHLSVYAVPEYATFTFAGTVLTRTYVFMPPLLIFAGAWLMARRRFGLTVSLGLVTIAVAVVTSYTRILIAAFLVELCVVFLLTWIRSARLGLPFMNRFARWAVGAAVLVTVLGPRPSGRNAVCDLPHRSSCESEWRVRRRQFQRSSGQDIACCAQSG